MAGALAWNAAATTVTWFANPGETLADNNVAGSTFSSGTLSSSSLLIDSVNVTLDISGGYNGDLYGYLVYTVGGNSYSHLLLNRVGGGSGAVGSVSGFGTGATPASFAELQTFGVTLTGDGSGSSIHTTAAAAGTSYAAEGGGLNSTFGGSTLVGGGTWTLFLADLGAGDQSTLVSWGLSLTVVPEPVTWALIGFGGVLALVVGIRRRAGLARFGGGTMRG